MTPNQVRFLELGYLLDAVGNEIVVTPSEMFQWPTDTPSCYVVSPSEEGAVITRHVDNDVTVGEAYPGLTTTQALDVLHQDLVNIDNAIFAQMKAAA